MTEQQSEIYELQTMLRLIAQTDGTIPLVNPDGIFGSETERSVLAFQSNMACLQRESWISVRGTPSAMHTEYRKVSCVAVLLFSLFRETIMK